MKLKSIVIMTALTLTPAFADWGDKLERNWDETTGISKLYYGHSNSTLNLGLSHERRKGNLGIELQIMSSGDNGEADRPNANKSRQQVIAASFMHHLIDGTNADVYFGTGFSTIRHVDVDVEGDEEDVTSFGPAFKLGSGYYFNNEWSLGLEYMTVLNWSSDEVQREDAYGFLTLGYTY